jgi:hypothetical protein
MEGSRRLDGLGSDMRAGALVMNSVLPMRSLAALATELRGEESVISPHVVDPGELEVALGLLAAAGPRAAGAPAEYALVVEAVREGYLLHYGSPRIVRGADPDLALLAGDYLYALGLERLAAVGDLPAVRELADLISLVAQIHAEEGEGAAELWLASTVAVAAGPDEGHEAAKSALRSGAPGAAAGLWHLAHERAGVTGLTNELGRAAESINFVPTGSA